MSPRAVGHINQAPPPEALSFRFDPAYSKRKRIIDVFVASFSILATSPILAAAAAAIWIEDGGPVLFKQKRVGQFGRLFTIYKLRTMRVALSFDALSPASSADIRLTRVGRLLRKTSIDELPQLINVLRGDMALVGPRPEMPFVVSGYDRWQHMRHFAKPGITGLWQTSVRKTVPLHTTAASAIDIEYLRRASTVTDGKLVLKTLWVILSASGAY